jgi:hypothetical protein
MDPLVLRAEGENQLELNHWSSIVTVHKLLFLFLLCHNFKHRIVLENCRAHEAIVSLT